MVESASGLTATGSNSCRLEMSSANGAAPATDCSPNTTAARPESPLPGGGDLVRVADQRLRSAIPGDVRDFGRVSITLIGLITAPVFSAP